jgi:hypothetical protein
LIVSSAPPIPFASSTAITDLVAIIFYLVLLIFVATSSFLSKRALAANKTKCYFFLLYAPLYSTNFVPLNTMLLSYSINSANTLLLLINNAFNSVINNLPFNTRFGGHLIQGGKDCLVKGINKEGKEKYFALSFVDQATDYYKRIK